MKEAGIAGLLGNAVDNICFDVILRTEDMGTW